MDGIFRRQERLRRDSFDILGTRHDRNDLRGYDEFDRLEFSKIRHDWRGTVRKAFRGSGFHRSHRNQRGELPLRYGAGTGTRSRLVRGNRRNDEFDYRRHQQGRNDDVHDQADPRDYRSLVSYAIRGRFRNFARPWRQSDSRYRRFPDYERRRPVRTAVRMADPIQ